MDAIKFSEIDTNSKEGRYLMAAIAMLTTQPSLVIFGKKKKGTSMTPDEMIKALGGLCEKMYVL